MVACDLCLPDYTMSWPSRPQAQHPTLTVSFLLKNTLQVDQMFTQKTHQKTTRRNQIQLLYLDIVEGEYIICNIQGTWKEETSWDTWIGGRIILKGCWTIELHRIFNKNNNTCHYNVKRSSLFHSYYWHSSTPTVSTMMHLSHPGTSLKFLLLKKSGIKTSVHHFTVQTKQAVIHFGLLNQHMGGWWHGNCHLWKAVNARGLTSNETLLLNSCQGRANPAMSANYIEKI
jgi:hypothetical protein